MIHLIELRRLVAPAAAFKATAVPRSSRVMVLASAVLALIHDEPGADRVAEALVGGVLGTVNLAPS
jgi:hypothetical protein